METDLDPLQLLTTQQAAELLQVSQRTVERLIRCKGLPALKVGGQWRICASHLTKWIEGLNDCELSSPVLTPDPTKCET
jgi:excisionase family DNA binding protein